MKLQIALILTLLSIQAHAQKVLPDKSTPLDKKKVEQCKKMVDAINSKQLKCDTILIRPFGKDSVSYQFKGVYFDKKNRLRKYFRKEITQDGDNGHIVMSAYYDESGSLIYITYSGSHHCGEDSEYYYVHHGKMIDFMCELKCGCCEEDLTEEEINKIRPVVETIRWVISSLQRRGRFDTINLIIGYDAQNTITQWQLSSTRWASFSAIIK